jgi:phosphoserine phosphatase
MERFTVTALGDDLDDARAAALADSLRAAGAVLLTSTWLSERAPGVIRVDIEAPAAGGQPPRAAGRALRRALLDEPGAAGIDIAVVTAAVAAPGPRLLVADMDSTLIQCECIDELARRHGVGDEIADLTRRAMLGELDFEQSLHARVARLAGLDAAVLDDLAASLPITDGAARLVRGVRAAGGQAAVVSGGFTFATGALVARLGLDHAHANTLGVAGGRLTGEVIGDVVTPQRKAALVEELAAAAGLALDRVVAIGDGANDLLMLDRAGLGVAFHAKPKVAAAADTAITRGGLERVLYLLGWTRADVEALDAGG